MVNGEDILALLNRANEGEDAGLLYLEFFASGQDGDAMLGKSNYEPDPKPVKKPKKGPK